LTLAACESKKLKSEWGRYIKARGIKKGQERRDTAAVGTGEIKASTV
jgi:hypothetical protein